MKKKNLKTIQSLNNRHLIKHIATCERDSCYYVIFPLADGGNLLDYWEREHETAAKRTPELVCWCLRQMCGLADALRALHHGFKGSGHLRHGDLKPANILLFEEDGDKFLAIADFGVSKIHTAPTGMRQNGTTTKATTRKYEAPEVGPHFKNQPRHRVYDIWSLGCVFLEFVIWILYDHKAIKNFEKSRYKSSKNPGCSFYQTTDAGEAELDSGVVEAFKALREDRRCRGTAIEALINLVEEKVLVVEAEKRYKADKLHEELGKIVRDATQTPSNLHKVCDRPTEIPKIFLSTEQASPDVYQS